MTTPATGTALLVLVGFVLPGFVAVLLNLGSIARAAAVSGSVLSGARPGLRAGPAQAAHRSWYGAFVLDPDGNNVEAVCHRRSSR